MKVFLDPHAVTSFAVQDALGRVWAASDGRIPRPHCVECRREVDDVSQVPVPAAAAVVYMVRCHGEADVVRFVQEDGFLMVLPAFASSSESRRLLLAWLAAGAIEEPEL